MECLGENTVVDLLDALLAPERRQAIESHAASCASCRKLLSELVKRSSRSSAPSFSPRTPERAIEPGSTVGRYQVRAKIGTGAMGAVFAAWDPELDRTVALKVLHPILAHRERIQSEARAMARLAHPHVVAAYDAGTAGDDLFLAMELVAGQSLRAWLKEKPRTTPEIVEVFRQAGSGLAAAHRAGLVHRDFKPENVLVGTDGRARVGDFGLAAGAEGGAELAGTPAYMAPEQLENGAATAASDQFAFCVSLYEALHGERPFAINLPDEMRAGIATARRRVDPARARAIARGLAPNPSDRHPSMDALLAALGQDGHRARRRAAAGGLAILGLAFAAWAGAWGSGPRICRDAPAAFGKVWNPARKAAIRARFLGSDFPYAPDAWSAVEKGLDRFGERWIAARTDACEATRVRGEQSDQILGLRMVCLDRALTETSALVTLFETADADLVTEAARAVDGLPPFDSCSNPASLLAPVPLPEGKDADEVAAVEQDIARGRALCDSRRWEDAIVAGESAVERARTVNHEPTLASALFLLGEAQLGAGDAPGAESSLRDAFAHAHTGKDDLLAARAATEMVYVVGQLARRFADGLEWGFHAETALQRAGGDPEIEARLAGDLGHIRYGEADYTAARMHYEKALEIRTRIGGADSRGAAMALFNLARAVMAEGDNPTAVEMTVRAIATLEKVLGPRHPDVSKALNGLAVIQVNQGKYHDALATLDRALAIVEPALAKDHPDIGRIQINRGFALQEMGRYEEALAAQAKALAIFDREGGDRMAVGAALTGAGDAELSLGRKEAALATHRKALAVREEALGPEHEEVAVSLESIAGVEIELGRHAEALVGYTRALAIRDALDPEYFENAYPLAGMGKAHLGLGHAAAATPPLRRAVKLLEGYDGDAVMLAETRFLLGQALWDSGRSHEEARSLAASAETALASEGARAAEELARVRAWRRAH